MEAYPLVLARVFQRYYDENQFGGVADDFMAAIHSGQQERVRSMAVEAYDWDPDFNAQRFHAHYRDQRADLAEVFAAAVIHGCFYAVFVIAQNAHVDVNAPLDFKGAAHAPVSIAIQQINKDAPEHFLVFAALLERGANYKPAAEYPVMKAAMYLFDAYRTLAKIRNLAR